MTAKRIQAYIRAATARGRDVTQIGPFLATINPRDPNTWLNYAIPDEGARPTVADVEQLTRHYVGHDRLPRLEYVSTAAPRVLEVLEAAGYHLEHRLTLMTIGTVDDLAEVPFPEDVAVRPPREDELGGVRMVQNRGYGETSPPSEAQIDALRRSIASGGGAQVALCAKTPVGAGEFTAPADGMTEVTSIAVLPEYRRRGIGAALTVALTRAAFAAGATAPFLMADESEARIYRRVGYHDLGEVLTVARPEQEPG